MDSLWHFLATDIFTAQTPGTAISRHGRCRRAVVQPCTGKAADRVMSRTSLLIMIVDDSPDRASKLKSLIEFMDVPQVQVAVPENWQSGIGDRRLAAVFLSDDLEQDRLHRVITDVGERDPNVPIVVVNNCEDETGK